MPIEVLIRILLIQILTSYLSLLSDSILLGCCHSTIKPAYGLASFRTAVARGFVLAELAEEVLSKSDCWEVTTSAQMGILTFRFVSKDRTTSAIVADTINHRMVDEMIADGFAMVSSTSLKGHVVLRLCTINPRATEEDIRETIQKLESFGRRLSSR